MAGWICGYVINFPQYHSARFDPRCDPKRKILDSNRAIHFDLEICKTTTEKSKVAKLNASWNYVNGFWAFLGTHLVVTVFRKLLVKLNDTWVFFFHFSHPETFLTEFGLKIMVFERFCLNITVFENFGSNLTVFERSCCNLTTFRNFCMNFLVYKHFCFNFAVFDRFFVWTQ